MNSVEKLIAELCPEGVEWKQIGEITKVLRGRRLTKSYLTEGEKFPVFHGGLDPLGYYQESNRPGHSVMIINVGASAGTVGFSKVDFWSSDGCYCLENKDYFLSRFVYYFLITQESNLRSKVRRAGIPTLDAIALEKIFIPIPPLPIQHQIVQILDSFTQLEAELEAELEARSRQYDFYRNQLLSFEGKDVEWKTLGEIGKFTRGKRFVKTDMVADGVPCIHYGEMYTHYGIFAEKSKSFLEPELAKKLRVANQSDVVFVAAGETIEDIGQGTAWLGDEDVVFHDACFSFKSDLDPKFVAYFSRTKLFHDQIKRHISSGKISSINAKGLEVAKIPIPPIEEQHRIVQILDQFDALVNDISTGLPAEIKARRTQYEYYRNQLLDFKKLETA